MRAEEHDSLGRFALLSGNPDATCIPNLKNGSNPGIGVEFPDLENDGGHAFYLGVELARAEIAWQLGKRYTQDQALMWGCATDQTELTVDLHTFKPAGTTLQKK